MSAETTEKVSLAVFMGGSNTKYWPPKWRCIETHFGERWGVVVPSGHGPDGWSYGPYVVMWRETGDEKVHPSTFNVVIDNKVWRCYSNTAVSDVIKAFGHPPIDVSASVTGDDAECTPVPLIGEEP